MLVIHVGLGVFVAVDADDRDELDRRALMTVKTGTPLFSVTARIDREVGRVMQSELTCLPVYLIVTGQARFGEACPRMLGYIVSPVAGYAVFVASRREEERAPRPAVATRTYGHFVRADQRKAVGLRRMVEHRA